MKKIIITGASRGIGYEMVQWLAAKGHRILALSRNDRPVSELHLENVTSYCCDLSDKASLGNLATYIKDHWGTTDVLINNAGRLMNRPFLESDLDEFRRVYEVNVFGVAAITQLVIPFMGKQGHIVNISSMGGVQGSVKFPGLSAYSSSKGALITLTELLAEEFKESGISFNVLALGAVQTEMLEEAFPGFKAPVSAEEMAEYIGRFALEGAKYFNGKLLQVSNSTP